MPVAYSYIRFSTKEQEQGDSYRRQLEKSRKWIEQKAGVVEADDYSILDLGVSAFKGRNLHKEKGGLGVFIEKCREGKIKKGSYLVIEALDRFSRADPLDAAQLLKTIIIDYGINVVTLIPQVKEHTKASFKDTFSIMGIVYELCTANAYSVVLSKRLKEDWEKRRNKTRDGATLNTKIVPSWIDVEITGEKRSLEYRLKLNENKARIIRTIFDEVISGTAQNQLIKYLNKNVDPLPRLIEGKKRKSGASWSRSYLSRLIRDRRLLGELQLYKKNEDGRLVPDGEPIQDYYPKVISPDKFYLAQSKKREHKRINKIQKQESYPNILMGLVTCLADGYKMYQMNGWNKRKYGRYEYSRLQSYGYRIGKSNFSLTIDYKKLEALVLGCMSEIRSVDIVGLESNGKHLSDTISVIDGMRIRLNEIDRRLLDDSYLEQYGSLLDMRQSIKQKIKEKTDELENLQAVSPKSKKDILKELAKFRPHGISNDEKMILYRKYAKILPDIIHKILVLPLKVGTKKNSAFGIIVLRSGKQRFFILDADETVEDVLYTDKDYNPIWMSTKDGHVFWERAKGVPETETLEIYAQIRPSGRVGDGEPPNPFVLLGNLQERMSRYAREKAAAGKETGTIEFSFKDFAFQYLSEKADKSKRKRAIDKKPILVDDGRYVWKIGSK